MVVACVALAIALSGAGYAAVALPRNSVGTPQLKRGAVVNAKIRNNAVNGPKVRNDSLGGADVNEASLGKVPSAAAADTAANAQRLDGIDGAAFGNAQAFTGPDFHPRGSTTTFAYAGSGGISRTAGGDFFVADLNVPQGAAITRIVYYVVDNDAASFTLFFSRYQPATRGVVDIANANTAAAALPASPAVQAVEITGSPITTVDNTQYAYHLLVSPAVNNANHTIVGARVDYTLP
jgi:hypothetical protein